MQIWVSEFRMIIHCTDTLYVFASQKGLSIHKSKCVCSDEFEVNEIVGHKRLTNNGFFIVFCCCRRHMKTGKKNREITIYKSFIYVFDDTTFLMNSGILM